MSWIDDELQTLDLGDVRRNQRLARLVMDLAAQPSASVPEACGNWAETKAAYRLWANAEVAPEAIRVAQRDATLRRLRGRSRILILQDTTDLDFRTHPATTGLGPLEHPRQQGLKVHSSLAVSLDGVPLGLLQQAVWARDPEQTGQRHTRRRRPTEAKESQRWLTALAASQDAVPAEIGCLTVADRKADIYDLFARPRRTGSELLIRASHNRRITQEAGYLKQAVAAAPAVGEHVLVVGRTPQQRARQASLTLRVAALDLVPPRHHRQRGQCQPVPVWAIEAREEHPPASVPPVHWLLLSTEPVTTGAAAVQALEWYARRWLIERYHFVLKSGCRLEALQLATRERLERALVTYELVAWRLLWLTTEARATPELPCTVALSPSEWQALWCTHHRTPTPPADPPTLHEAVRWIAQLGGFLARRGDGEPGVKTLWQGWQRFQDIAATWELLHDPAPRPTCG